MSGKQRSSTLKRQTTNDLLVLFDIDGTLVRGKAGGLDRWHARLRNTFTSIFQLTTFRVPDVYHVNGFVDRATYYHIARLNNISDSLAQEKYELYRTHYTQLFSDELKQGQIDYPIIDDAVGLVKILAQLNHITLGVITGNIEPVGKLKLAHVQIDNYFSYGIFGDYYEQRDHMARAVPEHAYKHMGKKFLPHNIVVIGDTVHDIRAGKALGAQTIAVTTGLTDSREKLEAENPALVVDSLLDEKVMKLLDLPI